MGLTLNNLTSFGSAKVGGIEYQFGTPVLQTTNGASFTGALTLPSYKAGQDIYILVQSIGVNSDIAAGCTLEGVAMTQVYNVAGSGGGSPNFNMGVYRISRDDLPNPAATSVSAVASYNGSRLNALFSPLTVIGAKRQGLNDYTMFNSGSAVAGVATFANVTAVPESLIWFFVSASASATGTFSWSGATELYDAQQETTGHMATQALLTTPNGLDTTNITYTNSAPTGLFVLGRAIVLRSE